MLVAIPQVFFFFPFDFFCKILGHQINKKTPPTQQTKAAPTTRLPVATLRSEAEPEQQKRRQDLDVEQLAQLTQLRHVGFSDSKVVVLPPGYFPGKGWGVGGWGGRSRDGNLFGRYLSIYLRVSTTFKGLVGPVFFLFGGG